jgi:hypothetical protein
MSGQQITRAVGPTSLFGLFLLAAMALSLWLYWRAVEAVVWTQNVATAARRVDQLMLRVHWEGIEGREGQAWKKAADELAEQFADKLGEKGVETTFLYRPDAPQYSASEPGRPANQFEADLIARFMLPRAEGEEPPRVENNLPDKDRSYYYQPIYAKRECTAVCHFAAPPGGVFNVGTTGDRLAEGDLMAVAKISLANNEMRETLLTIWNRFLAIAITTTALVMLAFCIVIRYTTARGALREGPEIPNKQ